MEQHVEIHDTREISDFKTITFSGYKKTSVSSELTKSIIQGHIESASNWVGELICAGHYLIIWEIIISVVSRNIHCGNPKLPIYISLRINEFKEFISCGYGDNMLTMRNNIEIRKMFSDIITILCESIKKYTINSEIKIKSDDIDITKIRDKLHAPDLFQTNCYNSNDPKDLFIFANEFAYSLKSRDTMLSCYWIEWVIEYSVKGEKIFPREWVDVHKSSKMDVIWLVWDIILEQVKLKNDKLSIKITESLVHMFCLKYTKGVVRKRKYVIYYAIRLITDIYDNEIPIIRNKEALDLVSSKINMIYKAIKKNENNPNDYTVCEKDKITSNTMKRIKIMNEMTPTIL